MSRLIDADALVAKYGNWYTEEGSEEGFIGTIKSLVDTMPTIEPERKIGKWVKRPYDGIYCTACGKGWLYVLGAPGDIENYHYCPHCGAKMEGAEQE